MKRNDLISKLKKPILYSAFPIVLFATYGTMKNVTPAIQPKINPSGMLVDTLPGDTVNDPLPADTMGYPGDTLPKDTSTYPTEDFFPADTAGAGESFEPFPVDTNGFNP